MKFTFPKKDQKSAPKTHILVRLTEEEKGTRRLVREDGTELLEIGAGKASELTQRRFITLCRSIIATARQHKKKKLALDFSATPQLFKNLKHLSPETLSEIVATNFEMANFEFTRFKSKKSDYQGVEEILVLSPVTPGIKAALQKGLQVGQAVNACRDLANTPGGDMTPKSLAKAAKQAVTGLPVTVKTFGQAEIHKLGMGALYGVGSGSSEETTFTVMEYQGSPSASGGKPIVLVGKGITFDSGGLNLKPSNSIYEMHMDMSGAAAVIHTVALAARLKLKRKVIGLIPAAENMPGNNAFRPGDVLRSLSGKTIEVLNTDAEGRLVLADAITYAKRHNPAVVIDVATLTGAAMVALGVRASGLMTRDDALAEALAQCGEESGDYVWRLPLWDEYEDLVRGNFADLANIATNGTRYGGAIEGGMFLWQFAKDLSCPWAHLDIAPRMTSAPGDELSKGAAGEPVRLLIRFIESWKP